MNKQRQKNLRQKSLRQDANGPEWQTEVEEIEEIKKTLGRTRT